MIGKGARADTDRMLTMAPRERVSNGRKAWVTPCVPKRLMARSRSSAVRSLRSSEIESPALLMRISRDSTFLRAPSICAAFVTSRVRGVTRPSVWAKGWRVPAYTRFAPLLKASSTNARPIPRLAPVTKTALSAIFIFAPYVERLIVIVARTDLIFIALALYRSHNNDDDDRGG